ncbi:MAG: PSD1 and planctomycete cytochrome C domain-containing protein [Planctomycetia bacterium]|nr:PSD1 and planctomycete cytochrome C domain-containing protein [Planctomycetia bacterium]
MIRLNNTPEQFPPAIPVRLSALILLMVSTAGPLVAAELKKINFNSDIRPLLSDNCFQCHGPDDKKRQAGLRLDLREAALAINESGDAALVPGDLQASGLVKRILSTDPEERMPPEESHKKLSDEQVDLLKRWVAEGAVYQGHWSFQPVERPAVPRVTDEKWPRNAIDHFLLARLEKENLKPSPEANQRTLLRRLSLDLTGLPPSPEEIASFLADQSPEAYEKVVDRLLASPGYGEQMALQWLDFARYADSNGFQADSSRKQWPWRDWVIKAYNDNLPFDRFTTEQLAGDLLPAASNSQIVATGFNRNHRLNGEGGLIAEEWRVETVIDRVETTGLTWLGLTFNCCRCHDHKYDPITQKEFYQLFAFFNNITESGTLQAGDGQNNEPIVLAITPEQEAELAKLDQSHKAAEKNLAEENQALPAQAVEWAEKNCHLIGEESPFPAELKQSLAIDADQRTPAQRGVIETFFRTYESPLIKRAQENVAQSKKVRDEFKARLPSVMIMREGPVRDAFQLVRGEYDKHGDKVTAGLPAAFASLPADAPLNRLGLAGWIVSSANPLTARVWVNRAWERFFGVGLVKTSENLGSQAEFPVHPELLDWLAAEFMQPTSSVAVSGQPAHQWDMKAIHKVIVTSAAYRQATALNKTLAQKDPENRLIARGPRFRLSGEALRDQALAISGLLIDRVGGPSVRPYMPNGVWDETTRYGDLRNYKHDAGESLYRRSMYTIWKRTAAPPTMLIFDAPNREICTVKRSRTNTPLQALSLLNEITYVEAARKLAERMIAEGGSSVEDRLKYGFQLVTAREPVAGELQVLAEGFGRDIARFQDQKAEAEKFLAFGDSTSTKASNPLELAAYALAANVLLNLDEVVTRE